MNTFYKKNKIIILIWIVLATATVVSGYYIVYNEPPSNNPTPSQPTVQTNSTTTNANPTLSPTESTPKENKPNTLTTSTTIIDNESPPVIPPQPSSAGTIQNQLQTTLVVGDKSYSVTVPEGSSVYDLLKVISETTDFRFGGRDYGGQLGFFVDEINGVKNSSQAKKYWIYSINGQKAKIGVSAYTLQPNDVITWTYEDEAY
ncbi:MAG: DUF4430 domain-containing protein [Patescibacteria group bacterium]